MSAEPYKRLFVAEMQHQKATAKYALPAEQRTLLLRNGETPPSAKFNL
jgi:hypothetical protein